ncbi:MAG: hypothetical protein DIU63_10410 [Proteobacteria bacterium]|jgi:Uncharacterized conserved protein|nr:MAG: hypothetical protein DIU63_10410 [Pseudomonadota bacterium]
MPELTLQARALQLAERIDLKGLEREDQLSSNPLAFGLGPHGMVVLFRFGAVVFIGLNPLQEEEIIASLKGRLIEPLPVREEESVTILVKPEADDSIVAGNVELKNTAPERLLLIAEALAVSVALAHDEQRIGQAFDRIEPVASSLKRRKLLRGSRGDLLEQIGEALHIQQRLAGRLEVDRPDVLWDHPELERLWVKLADEYDLALRARAIGQKLEVIRETADTMADLLSTRTSHRLEWYIILLILVEILLGLYDRFFS